MPGPDRGRGRRALRGAHPQTSFAALGRRGAEIGSSPFARLEKLGARALLPGAGYHGCTSFHLAEYRIESPLVAVGRPAAGGGWEVVTGVAVDADRLDELGHDVEGDRPVVRGSVGAADACPFPVAVAYAER